MAKARNLSKTCRYFGIHRSRIYKRKERKREDSDAADVEMIRLLFNERKGKVGIRQLKMLLYRRFRRVINRKKIARIKRENGFVTRIRRKKSYNVISKLAQEHRVFPNILKRKFKISVPDSVYSTDITELPYGKGVKAYLAVVKDLATREVLGSELSQRINVKFVNDATKKAIYRIPRAKRRKLIMHSDQGFHFTHFSYRRLLAKNGITQSMSRKGNCLDNAPVESFFSHLKDHLDLQACKTFEELTSHVTSEIKYYNYERPQWNLKRMPPKQFRRHLRIC